MAGRVATHPHVVLRLVLGEPGTARQRMVHGARKVGHPRTSRCTCIGGFPGSLGHTGGW